MTEDDIALVRELLLTATSNSLDRDTRAAWKRERDELLERIEVIPG